VRKADNCGIFKGVLVNPEIRRLSDIARAIYDKFPADGKYILDSNRIIVCQSY
jgi:S-adenosylmethionine synthetase